MYMEKKTDKRGRYMDSWTPEKKKKMMAKLARKRWANTSMEDRKKYGQKLLKGRLKNK